MMLALKALQFFLATFLLATSVGKLLDVRGFAQVLLTYDSLPEAMVLPVALGPPLLELGLSVWLFSGVELKLAALAAIVLHVQFTAVAVSANLRGLDIPNCGCFGVFLARPMTWATVVEDALLTFMCVALFVLARRLSVDTRVMR